MEKICLFIAGFLLVLGCQNPKKASEESLVYEIYLDEAVKKSYALSDLADSIEYIYLQGKRLRVTISSACMSIPILTLLQAG